MITGKRGHAIIIWQRKFTTNSVWIGCHHVKTGNNVVKFASGVKKEDEDMRGRAFLLDGDFIRSFPIVTNGKIACYDVPLEKILPFEIIKTQPAKTHTNQA